MATWTPESIRPWVAAWDERVRRDLSRFDQLVPEAAARGSVLREPASEEQIAAVEARLGVGLPNSYRAFLGVSNGAHASSLGAETMAHGAPLRHGFLPVEEIAPMTEADPLTVSIWTVEPELRDPARDVPSEPGTIRDVRYYAPLAQGLLISRPLDVFRDVLVPREGVAEWEFWFFLKEGAGAHGSFADFLRYQVDRPDLRPTPDRADELVRLVRAGNHPMLLELAELGDPRAGDLAEAVLVDPKLAEDYWLHALDALRQLADARHVPALRAAWERARTERAQLYILAALETSGDPDIGELLTQAAEHDRHGMVQRWAAGRLRRRGS